MISNTLHLITLIAIPNSEFSVLNNLNMMYSIIQFLEITLIKAQFKMNTPFSNLKKYPSKFLIPSINL